MTELTNSTDKTQAADAINRKAERKEEVQKRGNRRSVWFGVGMFGLIGWAVAVPTLIGIALGVWLDRVVPMNFPWTLALLLAGAMLGCLNAWWWINKESEDD